MSRQEDVAAELEQVSEEIARFIDECPDETWRSVSREEGWTLAAVAYHCAQGNDLALGWICQMLTLRPVYETPETHDALNAVEAKRHADASKAEVAETLRRSTARTARFFRALTDEELSRSAMHGVAEREMTVGQFMGAFVRHMQGHLASLKEGAAG
jgi:uncharacterized damage-inducible protein DinB